MVSISFLIYKTELFGLFHMLQKKKSKEISRQIRFFPQKSACLPNSRSFAKRPSRQIWRRHGHRNDGKMVNRPHRWNNMRIVVSLLQYWLCTAVGFRLIFFFFVNLVSILLLSWASFFRTHTTSSHPFLVMAPKREVGYWCKFFLVLSKLNGFVCFKSTHFRFSHLYILLFLRVGSLYKH